MAYFAVRFECYVCGYNGTPRQMVRLDEESRGIAERRRNELELPQIPFIEQTKICRNCHLSILSEIQSYEEDPDPTVLKVLLRTSHTSCLVCGRFQNLSRMSPSARLDIFLKTGMFAPDGVRICGGHLSEEGHLLPPFMNGLRGITRPYNLKGNELKHILVSLREAVLNYKSMNKYNNEDNFTDEEFQALTPIKKVQFTDLFEFCNRVNIHQKNRTVEKKDLLCFLCKLRQGLSDQFLMGMFSYSSRQAVSLAVQKVRVSLLQQFVPQNVGYQHIERGQYIARHVTDFANTLYNPEPNYRRAIAYIDGTYIKIPKSRTFQVLRQSYCVHKGYHLLKPALIVAPNGYILDVHGPYFADSRNNDAAMLRHEYERDLMGLRNWFQEGDIFMLDRGYRDAQNFLADLGIVVKMPVALGIGQHQLTTEEANTSRLVTKTRWIVEARNGHIKNMFKFFRDTVPMPQVPHIGDYIRIACAIINKYHEPITMEGANAELAQIMLNRANEINELQLRIEEEGLLRRHGRWLPMEENQLLNFPVLGLEYLRELTFGIFQIKLAPSYVQDNRQDLGNVLFEFDERIDNPGLLRMRVKSRHRNSIKYQLWIKYNVSLEGVPIQGYYCTCKSGSRTLGTCSHVASVLWYLGYARHAANVKYPSTQILNTISDAAERHNNEEPMIV